MSVIYFDRDYNLCERTGEEGSYVYTPLKQYQIRNLDFPEIRDSVAWVDEAPFYCKIIGIERGGVVYHYPKWATGVDYKVEDIVYRDFETPTERRYYRCRTNNRSNTFNAPQRWQTTSYWILYSNQEQEDLINRIDFKIVCHFSTNADWQNNFSFDDIQVLSVDYRNVWYNQTIREYLEAHRAS